MKLLILFCLLGAALAFWEPDNLNLNRNADLGQDCTSDAECAVLCTLSCNPLKLKGQVCAQGRCFCRVRARLAD